MQLMMPKKKKDYPPFGDFEAEGAVEEPPAEAMAPEEPDAEPMPIEAFIDDALTKLAEYRQEVAGGGGRNIVDLLNDTEDGGQAKGDLIDKISADLEDLKALCVGEAVEPPMAEEESNAGAAGLAP